MRLALITLVLVAACGKAGPTKRFRDKVATTVELDGFTLPIPAGYRNLAELIDQDRAMQIQDLVHSDDSVVVSEQRAPEELWIAIRSTPSMLELATQADCDQLVGYAVQAEGIARTAGVMASTPIGPACTFLIDVPATHDEVLGDIPARHTRSYSLRHAGMILELECGGTDVAARDRACKELLDGATARN